MNQLLTMFAAGIMVLLATSSANAEEQYKCEGNVRTLVALATRQIWSDIPVKLAPLSASSKHAAESSANVTAKVMIAARQTTVRVAYAKMQCIEIPKVPLKPGKPLTRIAPVRIEYRFQCRVKTTWHLGPKSGKLDKMIEVVAANESEAMGIAIARVQEQARVLLFPKGAKPTWTATDVTC